MNEHPPRGLEISPGASRALDDPLLVPTGGFVGGRIAPPPSKSYSHRALNLAWLTRRPATVRQLLEAEDTQLFRGALRAAGWSVRERHQEHSGAVEVQLSPPTSAPEHEIELFCGNAGTMFRLLTASLCVVPGRFVLDGSERLRERPIEPLVSALKQLGADIEPGDRTQGAPLRIRGASLRGGRCTLDAGASSQYLSALLMAGIFAPRALEIEVTALTSHPYVEVTLDVLERHGYRGARQTEAGFRVEPRSTESDAARDDLDVTVEADDSAAAYPAAAAMISGKPTVLEGLRRDSIQGDRRFLEVLAAMGASLLWKDDGGLEVGGTVARAIDVDMSSMPDQVPTLAAVAAYAPGTTVIRGAAHLRIKESDRLATMTSELRKVGVEIAERSDGLVIEGDPSRLERWPAQEDARIDPLGDHRIAMSLALVGIKRPRVWIHDPTTVGKSYPLFWRHLFGL